MNAHSSGDERVQDESYVSHLVGREAVVVLDWHVSAVHAVHADVVHLRDDNLRNMMKILMECTHRSIWEQLEEWVNHT